MSAAVRPSGGPWGARPRRRRPGLQHGAAGRGHHHERHPRRRVGLLRLRRGGAPTARIAVRAVLGIPVTLGGTPRSTLPGRFALGYIAADGDGNALTAWADPNGVFSAGFDGAGPRFGTVSLPAGVVGQALPFSATADDNWSTVAGISWLFGDGTGAAGASVSHVYGAAGSYVATARATDTSDNVSELSVVRRGRRSRGCSATAAGRRRRVGRARLRRRRHVTSRPRRATDGVGNVTAADGPVNVVAAPTPARRPTPAAPPTPTRTGSRTAATTTTARRAPWPSRPSTRPSSRARCS